MKAVEISGEEINLADEMKRITFMIGSQSINLGSFQIRERVLLHSCKINVIRYPQFFRQFPIFFKFPIPYNHQLRIGDFLPYKGKAFQQMPKTFHIVVGD